VTRDDPLEGQLVDDRYRLQRRSGSGGMSVVYLARREGSDQQLAIKFLRSAFVNLPDFVRRFQQEAKACQMLEHDNCVSVVDFGVAFGSPYLVMEFMSGKLLSEELAAGPLRVKQTVRIMQQVLSGLEHAHQRGVVHRDLKPGNIMLVGPSDDLARRVKIMDFGTAQLMTGDQSNPGHVGTDVGTPWYMAPEQAAGQPTDPRTDLYAVGVILFEMLTGERPYTADDPMRVLQMHLSSPIPSARALKPQMGLSPELEAVVVRAMQKQPADRQASAQQFSHELAHIPELRPRQPSGPMRRLQPTVEPDVSEPPVPREPAAQSHPLRILLVVAAALVAIVLLLLLRQTGVLDPGN